MSCRLEGLEARLCLSRSIEIVGPMPVGSLAHKSADIVIGPLPLSELPPHYGLLDLLDVAQPSGEKPQSKLWKHDDTWFMVFPDDSGTWIWRLDGSAWTSILRLTTATTFKADAVAVGDVTHILLEDSGSSVLASVQYVPGLPGTYHLWPQRPTLTSVSLDSGVETATLDIDSAGRMWIASDAVSDVNVRYSDYPYSSVSAPSTLASGIDSDDISVISGLADGSVGVLWSNQNTERYGFRTHAAGDDPMLWSIDEVPASQSAINFGNGMADDHLNLAPASDGTLFAAVKTSYDDSDYPAIALLIRQPDGTWDDLYEVDNTGTRPIVILNEKEDSVMVVYSFTDGGGSGDIVYKKASRANLIFGVRTTLMTDAALNNATSTRQAVSDDVVVVAASTSLNLHGIRLRQAQPGDTDFDGDVDLADLGNLSTHYGQLAGAWWSDGDFDDDGDVDLNDLGTLATDYGVT